jgi:hypothetical protein
MNTETPLGETREKKKWEIRQKHGKDKGKRKMNRKNPRRDKVRREMGKRQKHGKDKGKTRDNGN